MKKQISVQITEALLKDLTTKAKSQGLSRSVYIEQLVRKDLKENN